MEVVILPSTAELGRSSPTPSRRCSPSARRRPRLGHRQLAVPVYDELVQRHLAGRRQLRAGPRLPPRRVRRAASEPPGVVPIGDRSRVHRTGRLRACRGQRGPTGPRRPRRGVPLVRGGHREAGGVDLQLLGVGADGHIGFNEPGSSLGSRTLLKTLTGQTRADNARFFGSVDDVPRHVLTTGCGHDPRGATSSWWRPARRRRRPWPRWSKGRSRRWSRAPRPAPPARDGGGGRRGCLRR